MSDSSLRLSSWYTIIVFCTITYRFNQPQLGSVHRARATSHAARAMYWRIFTKEQALYLTVSSFHSLHEIADSLPHGIAKWSCATILIHAMLQPAKFNFTAVINRTVWCAGNRSRCFCLHKTPTLLTRAWPACNERRQTTVQFDRGIEPHCARLINGPTLSCREMSHGRTPSCASSTMRIRIVLGSGLPLTNTPPSWFTSPYDTQEPGSVNSNSHTLTSRRLLPSTNHLSLIPGRQLLS